LEILVVDFAFLHGEFEFVRLLLLFKLFQCLGESFFDLDLHAIVFFTVLRCNSIESRSRTFFFVVGVFVAYEAYFLAWHLFTHKIKTLDVSVLTEYIFQLLLSPV
jgi:hypothetical protein